MELGEDPARLRVGHIGEVTAVGQCWRLAYDDCELVQEFAREGLEDPDRLVQCIERNFSECLACRLEMGALGTPARLPIDANGVGRTSGIWLTLVQALCPKGAPPFHQLSRPNASRRD